MTNAKKLAAAVLHAKSRLEESKQQVYEELKIKLELLQDLSEMPGDVDELERQEQQLNSELETLEQDIKRMSLDMFGGIEEYDRSLRETWQHLFKIYESQIKEKRSIQVNWDFQSAMNAYADELKKVDIEVGLATPARIRRQIPRLQGYAEEFRQKAEKTALHASKMLIDMEQLAGKGADLARRKQRIVEEMEDIGARFRQHGISLQDQIVSEILNADANVLKQLRRDVFDSKLTQARTEREKGLAGEDPLKRISVS
jgi:hypothetical protein